MTDILLGDVMQLIAAANAARGLRDAGKQVLSPSVSDAERKLDSLFAVSRTLAVYGTLAPGKPNHHVVAPLGYPAFNPRIGGAAIPVHVLTSPALPSAFPELDDFEGHEYRRILIPVFRTDPAIARRLYTVANIYAAAAAPSDIEQRSDTKR